MQLGGSKQGLLKAISGRPVELGFANACSKNTVLFGAETIDLAALLDAGQRCFDLLPLPAREEMKREIGRELRRELRHAGLTPAELERLLRAFGGSLGYALAIEPGALPKPELLHLAVRDADTVGALLQRLEAMTTREAGIEWKTAPRRRPRRALLQRAAARRRPAVLAGLRAERGFVVDGVGHRGPGARPAPRRGRPPRHAA